MVPCLPPPPPPQPRALRRRRALRTSPRPRARSAGCAVLRCVLVTTHTRHTRHTNRGARCPHARLPHIVAIMGVDDPSQCPVFFAGVSVEDRGSLISLHPVPDSPCPCTARVCECVSYLAYIYYIYIKYYNISATEQ